LSGGNDSAGVKSSVRLIVVAVAAVALMAGMFIGLRPLSASLTQISPDVRVLTVSCGIGYLPGVPDPADPVPLKSDPGVFLPHKTYAEHCALVTSWQPWVAWLLTAIGLGGMAVLFAGRKDRPGVWPGA
jgi:hypothetical protein